MNIRCSIMCRTVMHVFLKMFLVRFKINFYFLNVFYTCLNNFAIIITNESKLTVILKKLSQFKKWCDTDKQFTIYWTIFIHFRNRQQRRHVLLYENHIVFCKQSGSDYHFKFSLATTTLGMSSIIKVTNGG